MHFDEETYDVDFDGSITGQQETKFRHLIEKHQLSSDFIGLLEQPNGFVTSNSYDEYKTLLWVFCEILGPFNIKIVFSEDCVPEGCCFHSNVDFSLDQSGSFEFELKNELVIHEGLELSEECKEQLKDKSEAFEEDFRITGNIRGMDLQTFLERTTRQ